MKTGSNRAMAHGAWMVTLLFLIASVSLGAVSGNIPVLEAPVGVAFFIFSVMGALIALRRSSNPVGWIFCAVGTLFAANSLMDMYALYEPSLPGARWAAWAATSTWPLAMPLLMLILLLFPDGSYLSDRWRRVGVVGVTAATTVAVATAVTPGTFADYPFRSPIGLSWIAGSQLESGGVAWVGVLGGMLGGVASLVARFSRSTGERRAQMKWFVLASVFMGVTTVFSSIVLSEQEAGAAGNPAFIDTIAVGAFVVSLSAVPVAAAIAILRYRLYDIDVVINRTLVYVVLTAILAATYSAIVAGASTFAGDSSLTVAGATLTVAGLFQPLRARVQGFIDQRFYRTKYDAELTIKRFNRRLRAEFDLETMARELVTVVQTTMQPRTIMLWLRPTGEGSPDGEAR